MNRASGLGSLLLLVFSVGSVGCKKGSSDFEGEIGMTIHAANGVTSAMDFETADQNVRLRLAAPGGNVSHALVKPDGKALLIVDEQRAYMDLDLSKAKAQVAADDPSGNPVVDKTGKRETIAGHDCQVWIIRHASGRRTETCVTEGLVAFDFGALLPGAPVAPTTVGNDMKQNKLFPLRSVEFDDQGKEMSRMEVVRVERKKMDRSVFEVPAGYTKVEAPAS